MHMAPARAGPQQGRRELREFSRLSDQSIAPGLVYGRL